MNDLFMKYEIYIYEIYILSWKEWFQDCVTVKTYLWTMNFIKLSSVLFMYDLKKCDSMKYDSRMLILKNMKKCSQIAMYDPANG